MDEHEYELLLRTLPPSLVKATQDPFTYAMKLRTHDVIQFESAVINNREWLTVCKPEFSGGNPALDGFQYNFERNLEVRIADIVWVCDAPYGS